MIEKIKMILQEVSEVYGCSLVCNESSPNSMILAECNEADKNHKWALEFSFDDQGLSVESYGLMYSDYKIEDFPLMSIQKDEVDLGSYFEVEGISKLKRTEISFMSDKTIEVIKLIVEKEGQGIHVELIESRDSKDFSVLLSNYFECQIPEIDDDGYQHYLIQRVGDQWLATAPEIGTWTQEKLYNALIIDYSYGEQLIHFTFYNKDAHLVQQSNVFIRSIEKIDHGLVFNSVKRNKRIKLVMEDRIAIRVYY